MFMAVTIFAASAAITKHSEPTAEQFFEQQFTGAQDVKWSNVEGGFKKVVFTWGGHRTEAYFNKNAEFVGAIRTIFYAQLPLSLIRTLDQQFKNQVVMDVREITNEEGTAYTLIYEKKNKQFKVRVTASGYLEEVTRIK